MPPPHPGRAALACLSCRQRKVKCSGDRPECRTCRQRATNCIYPGNQELNLQSSVSIEQTLDAGDELPTAAVVSKAVNAFFDYYGEIPFWFLRKHIFLKELNESKVPSHLLFCILAIGARFVEPCFKMYGGTMEAGEHFANLARLSLTKRYDEISLLNIHCNLILCVHEMGHGNEHRAWLQLGIASRISQALGLSFEHRLRHDTGISAEVERRTFWSCYLIERLLVNGRDRPLLTSSYAPTTLLPCPNTDFTLGRKSPAGTIYGEPSPNESLGAFTVRIADILSRIVDWGGAGFGGRHFDTRPPWTEGMPFQTFQKELNAWKNSLPEHMLVNEENLLAHIASGEGMAFGSMHIIYFQACGRLYRKYMPFIPPPSYDPAQGPIDGPAYIPDDSCPGFWARSVAQCIESAIKISILFARMDKKGLKPCTSPFIGISLIESSAIYIFCMHNRWSIHRKFMGEPARNMLICNLQQLISLQEVWPVAAYRLKTLRQFYEKVSLVKNRVVGGSPELLDTASFLSYSSMIDDEAKLFEIKERMLHYDRSDREKDGLPENLPLPEHDMFELLQLETENNDIGDESLDNSLSKYGPNST